MKLTRRIYEFATITRRYYSSGIIISENASKKLHAICERDKKRYYLRINVEPGGCHGFQYFMALTEKKREDDLIFGNSDAKVVVDKESLNLIEGSTLDYAEELIGSAFKLVKNPNATSDCGCGSSFDVKD